MIMHDSGEPGQQPGLGESALQAAVADMGVKRGGRNILVAEQPLEDPEVNPVL